MSDIQIIIETLLEVVAFVNFGVMIQRMASLEDGISIHLLIFAIIGLFAYLVAK